METPLPILWEKVSGAAAWFWSYPPEPPISAEDYHTIMEYHDRINRWTISPTEGEAGKAHTCFFLRKYDVEKEVFWVNTETNEVTRLAFFAKYRGYPERYSMEIGSIT